MLSTSLSSQGATPTKSKITGFFDTLNSRLTPAKSSSAPAYPTPTGQPIQQGTNPGMIGQQKPTPTAPIQKTVDVAGNTTHYATKPNPSVLAQQQALNKQGAGLVEDGIVGPRTREAIAKYGGTGASTSTSSPTTPSTATPKPKTETTPGVMPAKTPPPTPTYPGLITSLANQQDSPYNQATQQNIQSLQNSGGSQYNDTARKAIQGLLDTAGGNQEYADRAQQIANQAGSEISDIGRQGARAQAGYRTTGTSPVGEGNAAITAQTTAAQQQAVTEGANMQLAGNAQGLTAQQQQQAALNAGAGQALTGQGTQQTAFTNAGTLALTGQTQAQSALNSAAGYTAPSFQGYGSGQYVSPVTGTGVNGGGAQIQPSDPFYATLQSFAQLAAQGLYSAIPASITGNPVLNAQLNEMAKQINPGYNPVTSAAQSGIITGQAETIAQYQSALQQGQNLQAQLSDLISTFGLNPTDVNKANQGLQLIAKNTSDPYYKQLENYINDIANTYAQILVPPGGSSTDTSRGIAASMLDATASGTSILDTMRSLDEAAKAKIAGVQTSYGGGGGGSTSGGSTGGGFAETW